MGRQSSGTRGGQQPNDYTFKGKVKDVETLKNIKDPKVYKDVKEAISRFHAVLGVRERNVKLATLPPNTLGVQVNDVQSGERMGVYLNKKYFKNKKEADIKKLTNEGYKSGWSTQTNKPMAHTVTHELAHATWNTALKSPNAKAATKEVTTLYKSWLKDKGKSGYGKYAQTNVNEFWAETVTKAVHGKSDKYTTAVKRIAKKYKL